MLRRDAPSCLSPNQNGIRSHILNCVSMLRKLPRCILHKREGLVWIEVVVGVAAKAGSWTLRFVVLESPADGRLLAPRHCRQDATAACLGGWESSMGVAPLPQRLISGSGGTSALGSWLKVRGQGNGTPNWPQDCVAQYFLSPRRPFAQDIPFPRSHLLTFSRHSLHLNCSV